MFFSGLAARSGNLIFAGLLAVGTLTYLTGCDSGGESGSGGGGGFRTFNEKKDNVENKEAHEHHHEHGPHAGHIVELGGEEFHAEVTMDEKSRNIVVYLLKSDLKTALTTEAEALRLNLVHDGKPVQLELKPAPQDGETKGASRFQIAGEAVPAGLEDLEDLGGKVAVNIGGKDYSGELEGGHDHHDHDAAKATPEKEAEKPAAAAAPEKTEEKPAP